MSPHNFYFIYLIHYIYVGLFRPIYFLACQMVSFTPTDYLIHAKEFVNRNERRIKFFGKFK